MMAKGLIINVDGSSKEYDHDGDYRNLQRIVEGYIEAISFGDKNYFCYSNDESKMIGLDQNRLVTDLWYDSGQIIMIGDYIAGNVVFFGNVDDDGNSTDYPEELLKDLNWNKQKGNK
jgi:hypothetical protein